MNSWYVNLIDSERSAYYTFHPSFKDDSQRYFYTAGRLESLGSSDWAELLHLTIL